MHYLIDGHNLIGQCRTITLGAPDDEAQLVDLIHRWLLRHPHHRATIVFDGGVYGHPQKLDRPGVRAVFAHSPQDADARLQKLIAATDAPRGYRVVSADRMVRQAAQERGVEVIDARQWAVEIEKPIGARATGAKRARPEPKLPRAEVDEWMQLFGEREEH
jgi:uncharacterized protein